MPASADRNLLFGIVTLNMDFIDRDQLVAAMNTWALDKEKPLGQILEERQALSRSRRVLLEALVTEHVRQHDDDPARSLAALSTAETAREALTLLPDTDVQASLGRVAVDPYRTLSQIPTDLGAGAPLRPIQPASPASPRFRVLRPHAQGGLGAVYVALDGELNRHVALKQIQDQHADHPASRARFVLEAEVTGGLEHPGIVPVYSLGHDPTGRPFYAMRFIEGDSLKDAIARYHADDAGRAPGARTLELHKLLRRFLDVCEAIAYAHSRGVLHRDLKPGNIMVGRYGETLVVDWGLAKVVGTPESSGEATLRPPSAGGSSDTLAGSAIGTPAFMSPEQAAGDLDNLGPASDVYSLGATLHALLTGRPPIDGPDVATILDRVRSGDVAPPRQVKPDIPPTLEAICLKAMALRPVDRYATPLALAADLEAYLADEPVTARREPFPLRARRWARRHPRLVTGTAATVLMALVTFGALTAVVSAANARVRDRNARIARQNAELATANADLARSRTEVARERDQATAVTDFLVQSLRRADPTQDGRLVTISEVLGRAVEELAPRDDVGPVTRATILNAVAETYSSLGLVPEAVALSEQALALRVRALGADHPDTLTSQHNLAFALRAAGRFEEAIPLYCTFRKLTAVRGHPA